MTKITGRVSCTIDEGQCLLERASKTKTKLNRKLPTDKEMESINVLEILSLTENIHIKVLVRSQNADLDMGEF